MRSFKVHPWTRMMELPINVPPQEMKSKIEWGGQRLIAAAYYPFIWCIPIVLLGFSLLAVLLPHFGRESLFIAILFRLVVLLFYVALMGGAVIGYGRTFKGTQEEIQDVWKKLPWLPRSPGFKAS